MDTQCNCDLCTMCGYFAHGGGAAGGAVGGAAGGAELFQDIKTLMDLGLHLLPFGGGGGGGVNQLVIEMENLYQNWSEPDNICVMPDIGSNHTATTGKIAEDKILRLFRTKVDELNNVSIFPNFNTGPLISKAKFGRNFNLDQLENRVVLFDAFKLEGANEPDWKKRISSARKEKDILFLLGSFSYLMHVEIKSGRGQGNAIEQLKGCKEFLEKVHGTVLNDVKYVPVMATDAQTGTNRSLCENFLLKVNDLKMIANDAQIENQVQTFDAWWSNFTNLEAPTGTTPESYKNIVKRLLLTTSLVLTSLSSQLSQNTPYSHLIILRKSQWNLLSGRPQFAVIQGQQRSGKSMVLELGLSFIGSDKLTRVLVSCQFRIQNMLRKRFFAGSGIHFMYRKRDETLTEFLNQILDFVIMEENKEGYAGSIICLDDLPAEGLRNPGELQVLKSKSKYMWLVTDGSASEGECTNLGFQLLTL